MSDPFQLEESHGIKFVWNRLPTSKEDQQTLIVPIGFHYTPYVQNETIQLLDYDPLKCMCGAIISPKFSFSTRSKVWECPFCRKRNAFPKSYADFISDENLPAELLPENGTVEYRLGEKEANPPVFIFVIDIAIDEDELNEVKESIQQIISDLPSDCRIGIITYGKICNVL